MNKQYLNINRYTNNHCTEAGKEFIPHVCEGQCVHDCDDVNDAAYDTLEEWTEAHIDVVLDDDCMVCDYD